MKIKCIISQKKFIFMFHIMAMIGQSPYVFIFNFKIIFPKLVRFIKKNLNINFNHRILFLNMSNKINRFLKVRSVVRSKCLEEKKDLHVTSQLLVNPKPYNRNGHLLPISDEQQENNFLIYMIQNVNYIFLLYLN